MSVAIGIRCVDGIVIACDSQVGFGRGVPVKRLNANKIYSEANKFAVVAAGAVAHIERTWSAICSALKEEERKKGSLLNEDEYVSAIEPTMVTLHKVYNIDRSGYLGTNEKEFFNPILVFAGKTLEEEKESLCLYIVHREGLAEPLSDYGTAGSGAAFAELLLKSLYFEDIKVEDALPIVAYTINEVKEIDPNCGGPTKIGILKLEGFQELKEAEISQLLEKTRPILETVKNRLIPKALRGEIDEGSIKKLLE